MPTPRKGERQEHFIDRCMGDAEAVQDFPDADQRLAVCNSLWENRGKADIASEDLSQGGRVLEEIKARALLPVFEVCPCGEDHEHAERADDRKPLKNRQTRGHPDPFLKDELTMARSLNARADDQAAEVRAIYGDVLSDPAAFNLDAFNDATKDAQDTWQDTWNTATEVAATTAIVNALVSGENTVAAGILQGVPSRQAVINGMTRAAKFYTNTFFNDHVLPALQAKVLEVLDGTAATGVPDISAIRALLDRRLRSVPYWRVVANAATSRSYHYGILKAAQFQGFRTYRYTAVLDERTSQICRHLNGRVWTITDALNIVERVAASDDPEEVKRLTPWLKFDDVKDMGEDALRDAGVIVPPVHGNCRSSLTIVGSGSL